MKSTERFKESNHTICTCCNFYFNGLRRNLNARNAFLGAALATHSRTHINKIIKKRLNTH